MLQPAGGGLRCSLPRSPCRCQRPGLSRGALRHHPRRGARRLDWTEGQRATFCAQQFAAQAHHYAAFYPNAEHSIVEAGDEQVGRLYLDRADDEIRVVDIALLPAHRGAGIGTALLRSLLVEADRQGVPVRLHVLKTSPALRLYERLGFVAVADAGAYWAVERTVATAGDSDA